jgi:hypothetical protein
MGDFPSSGNHEAGFRRISTIHPFTIVKPGSNEEKLLHDKIQKWRFN